MPDPITLSARNEDWSPRIVQSQTVAGSPAAAAETIVCTVAIPGNLSIQTGVMLVGWVAFTVGTSGTAATLRIRQTGLAGTVIASSGATTAGIAAAALATLDAQGMDTAPVGAQVYVLTLQVAAAAAGSAVSAAQLVATVV